MEAAPISSRTRRRAARVAAAIAAALIGYGLWTVLDPRGCGPEMPWRLSRIYLIALSSMTPTLISGDVVFADHHYFCRNEPARGDLAEFTLPGEPVTPYIMRIIGLPGDRIALSDGVVTIDGAAVSRQWLESAIHTDSQGNSRPETRMIETLPGGARYVILLAGETGAAQNPLETMAEITVPAGSYFVLGDNRDNAVDSRMPREFGLVPRGLISDRPALVLWSEDRSRIGLRLR